jgi:LuxR family transcriptional activator of conjugal transfer of Ti plasmids
MIEPRTASFLEELQGAKSLDSLEGVLDSQLKWCGAERYTYIGLNPPNWKARSIVLTTYPSEWTERYKNRNYVFSDPVLIKARQALLPFVWGPEHDLPAHSKKQKRIMREFAEVGYQYGLTVPLRGFSGEFASLIISFGKQSDAFNEVVKNRNNELWISALYFHDQLWKTLIGEQSTSSVYLTERQIETLAWLATGKSMADVADTIGVSEHAVRYHVLKAAERLGTPNLTSTVARAIALGFVRT